MNSKLKSRRRRTLKQWAAFARRGMRKRTYKNNHYLHEHEHKIILRDAIALGGSFTADTLQARYGYYDVVTLRTALKRMNRAGLLEPTGRWGRNTMYKVRVRSERAAA